MLRLKYALALSLLLVLGGCRPLTWQPHGEAEVNGYPSETAGAYRPSGLGMSPMEAADPYSAEAYRVVSRPDEIVSVLKNGLTVIARRTASPVVSVQGYVRTGSLYEGKYLAGGLSHLLEHLLAGGSCQRRTEVENRDMLQRIGDNSDAYTSYDHTVFFVNTTPNHMAEAVDLVTGWLYGAKIMPKEYGREYEVVQRELEKDKGEADWVFDEMTHDTRYQVSPARIPVIGYQAVIQGLSRDDVYAYYKSTYVPENIIFGMAGNADPEEMLAAVRKYSVGVKPGRVPQKVIADEPPVHAPRLVAATFPKLGQAKLEIAFPSVKIADADMYPLDLLSAVLGLGESSLLVEELRNDKHLVTEIEAGDDTPGYVDGTFFVDMDVAPEKMKAAHDAVLAMIERAKTTPFPADRIERAKTMLKAQIAMSKLTSEQMVAAMVENFVDTGTPDDTYDRFINAVTAQQVMQAANKYLDTNKVLITALLPAEMPGGLAGAEQMLRQDLAVKEPASRPSSEPASMPAMAGTASEVPGQTVRTELANGTVLLVKRLPSSPVTSIQLYSLGGLTAEDAKTNGLGNLAMNTVTRGTKTRAANDVGEFFDSIGGSMGAGVTNNYWIWQATTLKGDWAKAFAVFADVVNAPTFEDSEVKAAQERIAADIEDEDRNWYAGGYRYFRECFFGPGNSPYQFTIAGTQDNVKAFTPEQVRAFYKDKALTGRRVLAIYGDVDVEQAKTLAAKYLGGGPKVAPAPADPFAGAKQFIAAKFGDAPGEGKPTLNVKEVKVQKWDNPQTAVFIGFDADMVSGDPDGAALVMAQTLTGGFTYPCGYIFETLRGLGLIYDAHSEVFPGRSPKEPGGFWVYAVCKPKNATKVVDEILTNIARLQGTDQDLIPSWFNRAKTLVVTDDAMERETAQADAEMASLNELMGLGYDWHDKFPDRIQAVQMKDVQAVAHRRLRDVIVTVSTSHPELVTTKPGVLTYDKFEPVDLTPKGVQHDTGAGGGK